MITSGPYPAWIRQTRAPVPPPPAKACDCQVHIYGDPARYPLKPGYTYLPPDATFENAKKMLAALGFGRGVIVFPTPYDTDHRLLFDTLEALTPDERKTWRATCIVRDKVPDSELARLKALGVVGSRFNIARRYEDFSHDAFRRAIARLSELGWHARLHFDPPEMLDFAGVLRGVKNVPMVIDHLGRLDFSLGLAQPAMRFILDMLRNENWWMMVSNGNRMSAMEAGWDDAIPFARAFIEAAPDRIIWASDWPHVRWTKKRMMNDAEAVELLYRYVDNDSALLRKILVANPARLHGFAA